MTALETNEVLKEERVKDAALAVRLGFADQKAFAEFFSEKGSRQDR